MSLRDDFEGALDAVKPPNPFALTYRATVRAQHRDDGSIDLDVGGAIGTINRVPLRSPIPGAQLFAKDGDIVRLRFEGASETAPYAEAFDPDLGADRPVARVKDATHGGYLAIFCTGTGTSFQIEFIGAPEPGGSIIPPAYPGPGAQLVDLTAGQPLPEMPAVTLVELAPGNVTSGSGRVSLNDD